MTYHDSTGETLLIIGASQASDRIAQQMAERGYPVAQASGARDAVSRVSTGGVSLILLDLTNDQATLELADTLMGLPSCPPIVVLDQNPTVERVVSALRIGVADYLSLSDGEDEIARRLTTHLDKARSAVRLAPARQEPALHDKAQRNGATQELSGLELNTARRLLILEDTPILLSTIELSLVELLIQRMPSLATYEEMSRAAFPSITDKKHALRLLRPHIARLRRKFESVQNARWRIANMRSQGYALRRIGAPSPDRASRSA
ncbi:MAG: hypothetical protein CUN48_09540 [Candidatus Thermofonsia Clade 3 bacterium]|jgi:DNA-binding response OmpR family regulator|uniref:OmpR/PhoB-type domain-containing protein n=1 Tax=Candidatus Thermofonsia Clade 3 bacterium TaxID=2364212 RepID=A0A2M8QBR7_9CHLR|nr:winged helix-turn-helix domain-containing protein [Candidatus Roseilinea sp. NK_OTU-006]PJF47253.1 MAG: hypothetical protein CUN48_09540 [Candidatus Thermofonsia Clade 3 bacterium]